jgi:hypothetical protein
MGVFGPGAFIRVWAFGPRMGHDDVIRRTHVGLYERHLDRADEENLNLSAEIRDALDDRMGFDDA